MRRPTRAHAASHAPTPRRADHHSNGENGGENGGAAATRRPRGIMPAAFRARKYSHVSESPDAPETPGGIRAVVADDAEELRIAPIVSCSQAWLATQGEAGAEVSDLDIETLLRAFSITSRIGESLGAMMTLAVKNDEANFEKVQAFKREFEERNGRLPSFAEMALADKEIADIARRLGEFGMDA